MIGGGGLQAEPAPRRAPEDSASPGSAGFHVEQPSVCPNCGRLTVPEVDERTPFVEPTRRRLCSLCRQKAGLSRRSFLWMGTIGAAGLVLASHLPVGLCRTEVLGPFEPNFDNIFREIYEPAIVEAINRPSLCAVLHFSGEEIAASRYSKGHWAAAIAGDDRLIVEARDIDLQVARNNALR